MPHAVPTILPCSQHCHGHSKLSPHGHHTLRPRCLSPKPAELHIVSVQCWGGFCRLSSASGLAQQSWQQLQRNWATKDHLWRWPQMKAVAVQSKLCGCFSFRHLQSGAQDLFDLLTVLLQKTQCYFPRATNERSKREGCEGEPGWSCVCLVCRCMSARGSCRSPSSPRGVQSCPAAAILAGGQGSGLWGGQWLGLAKLTLTRWAGPPPGCWSAGD